MDAREIVLVAYDQRRDKSRVRSSGYGGRRGYYMMGSGSLSEMELIPVKASGISPHSNAQPYAGQQNKAMASLGADRRVQGA